MIRTEENLRIKIGKKSCVWRIKTTKIVWNRCWWLDLCTSRRVNALNGARKCHAKLKQWLVPLEKPSNFVQLSNYFHTQAIHDQLKMSQSRSNCRFPIRFIFFDRSLPSKIWIVGGGSSQVLNKTQNYSMKLCLNVTLFRTWAGEHHNWAARRIMPPSKRCQEASIQLQIELHRRKKMKEKFPFSKSRFNEWKHGSPTHAQSRNEGFFFWPARMNENV